jgi:preprotein translocase subunit SecY
MKILKTILMYTLIIGISLIVYIGIILGLSWIIYKLSDVLFSYFDIRLQFELTYIFAVLLVISVLVVLLLILVQSKKSNITSSSKVWQNEEDYRLIAEYMGDEYFDNMDDPY